MKTVTAVISLVVGATVLAILAVLVRGYCLLILWGWLIAPVFGLPALGVAPAIGLALFLGLLLNQAEKSLSIGQILAQPLVALGIGYLVHLFI